VLIWRHTDRQTDEVIFSSPPLSRYVDRRSFGKTGQIVSLVSFSGLVHNAVVNTCSDVDDKRWSWLWLFVFVVLLVNHAPSVCLSVCLYVSLCVRVCVTGACLPVVDWHNTSRWRDVTHRRLHDNTQSRIVRHDTTRRHDVTPCTLTNIHTRTLHGCTHGAAQHAGDARTHPPS